MNFNSSHLFLFINHVYFLFHIYDYIYYTRTDPRVTYICLSGQTLWHSLVALFFSSVFLRPHWRTVYRMVSHHQIYSQHSININISGKWHDVDFFVSKLIHAKYYQKKALQHCKTSYICIYSKVINCINKFILHTL